MSNEDKMLQLVLQDSNLSSFYEFNPDEFTSIKSALKSDHSVVVAVAKIIQGVDEKNEKGIYKEVYNEVFNFLNNSLL